MISSSNYACFVNRLCFSTPVVLINVRGCIDVVHCMTRESHEVSCCVRDFRWSFAHFMFYFPIVCYEIHVKLAHISARWIGTIAYRVDWDEMLAAHFRFMLACLDFVKMSATALYFAVYDFTRMLGYNEMPLTHVSQFYFCMRCSNEVFSWSVFRFRSLFAQGYDEMLCFVHACLAV